MASIEEGKEITITQKNNLKIKKKALNTIELISQFSESLNGKENLERIQII